jgi:hypothetical protein
VRLTVLAAALVGLSLWSAAPKLSASAPEQSPLPAPATQAAPPAAAPSDLDAFMSKVLARRSEAWRNLHDYILSERERFELTGPNDLRLYGTKREFTWFVRGGYLIRSPVRFDGVAPGDRERHEYEERWLREEQAREKHQEEKAKEASEKDAKKEGEAAGDAGATPADLTGEPAGDTASLVGKGLEPRFISEAYFMQFKFDPGNYYLAGR